MPKYYILSDRYVLRGWQHTARLLIRRPTNAFKFLKEVDFQTLLLCDGNTDFNESNIKEEIRDLAIRMEKKGIIYSCEKGASLTEDQKYRFYDNRFVERVTWSVTGCCNYRCRHCFMDAPDGVLGQLSTKRALEIIDEIAECGILRVHITGGEPLIRPDFWQIIDGRGWHDWMRGVKGAEESALDAMKRAAARGHIVNASICVHRGNLPVLWETIEKLVGIGVRTISCSGISDTDLWKEKGKEYHLDRKELIEAEISLISKFYEAEMPVNLTLGGLIVMKKGSTEYQVAAESFPEGSDCSNCYLCEDARFATYIAPDGQLLPCLPMTGVPKEWTQRFPVLGDITLKEGLSDSFYMEFINRRIRQLFHENQKCGSCPYRMRCGGGFRASALQETGDLMESDLSLCYLFKHGYPERIRNCAEKAIRKYIRKRTKG